MAKMLASHSHLWIDSSPPWWVTVLLVLPTAIALLVLVVVLIRLRRR
jgi:hypothetical protein